MFLRNFENGPVVVGPLLAGHLGHMPQIVHY